MKRLDSLDYIIKLEEVKKELKLIASSPAFIAVKTALLNNGEKKIRTVKKTTGKWGCTKDISSTVKIILIKLGITYEEGNDSPRGGKEGNYIQLTNN